RASLEEAAGRCGLTKDDGVRSVRATIESGLGAGMRHPRDLSEIRAAAAERARRSGPQRRAAGPLPCEPSSSPSAAPQPPQRSISTQTVASGDGRGNNTTPGIPDEAFAECADLDQSDTDNGKRLRRYFGQDLLIREETEVPAGTWAHWT